MAVVLVLIKVVGSHKSPNVSLGYRCLECRKINLIERTVVNDDVNLVAILLIIVQSKVLYTCGNTVRLQSLNVGNNHTRSQIRVFAHVFEVASAERSAQNVDTWTKNHVLATIECLLAECLSVAVSQLRIPRCSKTRERRKRHTGVICLSGLHPFVPKHIGTDTMRTVVSPEIRHAETGDAGRTEFALRMDYGDLLVESHAFKCVFHALFNGLSRIQIHRNRLSQSHRGSKGCHESRCYGFLHYLYIF